MIHGVERRLRKRVVELVWWIAIGKVEEGAWAVNPLGNFVSFAGLLEIGGDDCPELDGKLCPAFSGHVGQKAFKDAEELFALSRCTNKAWGTLSDVLDK